MAVVIADIVARVFFRGVALPIGGGDRARRWRAKALALGSDRLLFPWPGPPSQKVSFSRFIALAYTHRACARDPVEVEWKREAEERRRERCLMGRQSLPNPVVNFLLTHSHAGDPFCAAGAC